MRERGREIQRTTDDLEGLVGRWGVCSEVADQGVESMKCQITKNLQY